MSNERLYFDNAATSFPKPPVVLEAMTHYATALGASPGRGAYAEAVETGRLVHRCRERLVELFNGRDPDHVIFTLNASDALNLAIKGIVHHFTRRDEPVHLVTTAMDHNSVLRPFNALGVATTRIAADPATGRVDPEDLRRALRPETRLVAAVHASNVTGTIEPIGAMGAVCRDAGVPFLVDGAQSVGHMPVDVEALGIDLLAFPGHKGLLGPLGTGGLYIRPGLEAIIEPLREGGTGSRSEEDVQPTTLPDRYEPGSHNAIGIIGLGAAVGWILERGVDTLWAHERALIEQMVDGLAGTPGLRVLGPQTAEGRCGVFAVVIDGLEASELAAILEDRYGILTRPGLHCAPHAHRTLATLDAGGATRLSLGPFLDDTHVDRAIDALNEVARAHAVVTT